MPLLPDLNEFTLLTDILLLQFGASTAIGIKWLRSRMSSEINYLSNFGQDFLNLTLFTN
jgi:hypothetical protein